MNWSTKSQKKIPKKCHLNNTSEHNADISSKESEIQYRSLFYQSPDPMFIWNINNYRFLAANKAALKHYGYSEKEFNSRVDEAFDELNQYNSYDMVFRIYAKKNVERRSSFSVKKIGR